jgi:hypothetical protein
MISGDHEKFRNTMIGMGLVFGAEVSEPTMDIYWMALKDWEVDAFQGAAAHLINTCEFMPRPFDFNRLRQASKPSAQAVWGQVLEQCKNWRNKADLPTGLVDRAVKAVGGWESIAMADTEKSLPHIQRRFLDAYESMEDADTTMTALPMLASLNLKRLK